jgi:sorting nexin-1/2
MDDMRIHEEMDPTFIEEPKIEWDKTKYNVCIVETVKAGHVSYKIQGCDKSGDFDIVRRFREFFALRNTLRKRWTGFYVPGIPPKKPLGNKDEITVNERWYLLNKFLQEVSTIPHLWESEELAAFIRPKLDVEKALSLMGKVTSAKVLERLEKYSGIDYLQVNNAGGKFRETLRDFVAGSKDINKFLINFKEYAKKLEQIRKMKLIAHSKLGGFLSKFEDNTVAMYGLADFTNTRIVSNTDNDATRTAVDNISKQIDNPYSKFKHWLKDEVIDFHALVEAISQRELIESWKHKTTNRKKS